MKTAMQDLIKYLEEIGIEGVEDFINPFLKKEKKQFIDFHIEVMKQGLIDEGEIKWQDKYLPKIKETAEKYYSETFKNPQ